MSNEGSLKSVIDVLISLRCFIVPGRGQAIRYLCHDKDVKLEEDVVTMGDWPKVKPSTVRDDLIFLMHFAVFSFNILP